ncbi:MAG: hypothetical protein QOJ85_1159, partial [Solirubrobacteraceae bacterium]|nr:hypothetical protein [Solirubrobacteraceae bacterium]
PHTPARPAPAPKKPAATARPKPRNPAAKTPVSAAPVRTPEELAKAKLARLTNKVRKVIADMQALAAGGTPNGLALAASMLQTTLRPLLASIDRLVAQFGLKLPPAGAASAAAAGNSGLADLLGPLR